MPRIGSPKLYLVIGVLVIVFLPPVVRYQALRYKNRKIIERIEDLKAENLRLEDEKKRLETDIVYVERRAREKIGLVRKGEIVMKSVPAKKK